MREEAIAAVALYAALNTFILFGLTVATSLVRRRYRVLVGDLGVPRLVRVMRGHANAIETMPIMLIMMLANALLGGSVIILHLLGLCFTAGRALHAWHFLHDDAPLWQRTYGFAASGLAMLVMAVGILGQAVMVYL
ncbi:MAG: MAPEG family protein [Rhizobiaceae bacterium]|nr:MAPEG family protein [Rhizobiaceae bacterium]